ncbi:NADH-quinone oxidoreductase subunit L [Pokkaliibacter sp. MBI-7]|uniref:NADH-quinone oxidoreductase subunit L n=1 Tax=Pokkaliibacter sp. MBI-7 TaxID=3040600 RepID=UPI00244D19BA|nr:NADH-quinone oxidoreductase subunit L [Pokkaliibacter sp. MBI-7]MDH2433338.1 NADH-quinone oxidoreductase subunit L [Pokkaliibacter sp. MBI-7]
MTDALVTLPMMHHLLWLIPCAPLLGALLIIALDGLPTRAYGIIASLAVLVSAICVALLWLSGSWDMPVQTAYEWMHIDNWQLDVGFRVDRFTLVMASVSAWVGLLIHLFSTQYMRHDFGERRYFAYLNLFVGGMLLFITADNLILLYAGWEIMGLCSYALVSHYYTKDENVDAGRKAFVTTRIGDTALAIGIFLCFMQFQSLNLEAIFQAAPQAPTGMIAAICILFMLGAFAKSAQFPLHVWLPDAMAGPSTVSALIHAATMITAGVYLIARTHVLFDLVPDVRWWVALVGAFTALYASVSAIGQNDIKRILAYSTISQIGYMFAALGVGGYSLALFHLAVHACFKALMFMSSGVIIEIYHHDHDIRNMGGLHKKQKFLSYAYLAGSLALAALPLVTASFYSKDAIIAATYTADHGAFLAGLGLLGALLTGIYSMRMYFMVFTGKARSEIHDYRMTWVMKLPLGLLAVGSICLGFIQLPDSWSFGPHLLLPWLEPVLTSVALPEGHAGEMLELLGAAAAVIGILIAWPLTKAEVRSGRGVGNIGFLNKALYIDELSKVLVIRPFLALCAVLGSVIDGLLLNGVLVAGVRRLMLNAAEVVSRGQGALVSRYVLLMVLGLMLIIGYLTVQL